MKRLYQASYCNAKCMAAVHLLGKSGKESNRYVERVSVACDSCGKAIEITPNRQGLYQKHFCDTACSAEWRSKYQRGEASPTWKGGLSFEPYPTTWSEPLREAIRSRDHRECRVCGKKENGKHHEVHHIDYDKRNLEENNLVTVCRSCHSRSNYHRSQWEAFFNGTPQFQ